MSDLIYVDRTLKFLANTRHQIACGVTPLVAFVVDDRVFD